jgi:hypothetical protein
MKFLAIIMVMFFASTATAETGQYDLNDQQCTGGVCFMDAAPVYDLEPIFEPTVFVSTPVQEPTPAAEPASCSNCTTVAASQCVAAEPVAACVSTRVRVRAHRTPVFTGTILKRVRANHCSRVFAHRIRRANRGGCN